MKSPIDARLVDSLRLDFKPVERPTVENSGNLPYVTHEGKFDLLGNEIKVYILNTGQRIINEELIINILTACKEPE